MRTIFNKLLFGALFFFVSWKGLDGLKINYYARTPYEADIAALETEGAHDPRYVTIHNAIAAGPYLTSADERSLTTDITYPVISQAQQDRLLAGQPVTAHLLVQLPKRPRNCENYNTCLLPDSTLLSGVTKAGLEKLSADNLHLLESDLLTIAPEALLLEPYTTPVALYWNLLMFLGSGLFAFTLLKSFFRRATSVSEYFEKISEKHAR
ncbi:hypothetical protein SAMN05421823_102737 [Catalinimonas alkaloidigena]|uniref:SURF1-like protein n=1 Tax=Catalinimonas alkaloidigena TaxID=1075417 RepID=A0A1G9BX04_9BACT|nr:hypothetical protein [Catalinimonas alkaloidigena]SDK43986.1 hypothetical protein SAMN05421823_102737 [Catalinimonas alkaloidigena]